MSLRLFVALDLPPAARAALMAFQDAAADPAVWRPLPEASLHVTLAFLGHRPEQERPAIEAALAGVPAWEAVPLALGDPLLLPPRRARVLTVALRDPEGALAALQGAVSDALAAAGAYTPESRPFRPHVTVARLRAGARAARAVEAAVEPVAFAAEAVVLYRSHGGRGGATYEPLLTRVAGG